MRLTCAGSGSDGNCYLLTDDNGKMLLIEAGVGIEKIKKLISYNIRDLQGVVVTHSHLDHSRSVAKLRQMGVRAFLPYELDEHRKTVQFGDFTVQSFPLTDSDGKFVHTNGDSSECPVFGFLIEHAEMGKLIYFTDCEFCRWRFTKQKVNHMLLGINYQEELAPRCEAKLGHVLTGHLSERTALEFIRINQSENLQTIVACHLSVGSCDPDKLIANIQKVAEIGVDTHVATSELDIQLRKDCPFG